MKKFQFFTLSAMITLGLILPLSLSSADNKKVADGEAVFKKNCNMCHYPDKTDKKLGPGLKGLFKNKELPQSHKPATDAAVREQIENGSKTMPGFGKKLSAEEIGSLIAYLKTL
ncbi:MAG: cytochrome c [Acidobacteriia bacterium]|nr:cytochrome c [Terriglobia bacterium]